MLWLTTVCELKTCHYSKFDAPQNAHTQDRDLQALRDTNVFDSTLLSAVL